MRILLTAARIRAMISGAMTEKDIELALRAHGVRYSYDTSAGYLAIRVPVRSGVVRIYRTASRSASWQVRSAAEAAPAIAAAPRYRYYY